MGDEIIKFVSAKSPKEQSKSVDAKVYVEILLNIDCPAEKEDICRVVKKFLAKIGTLYDCMTFSPENFRDFSMRENILQILICRNYLKPGETFSFESSCDLMEFFVYSLNSGDYQNAEIDEEDNSAVVASQCYTLPHSEFQNLWQNLVYDQDVKNEVVSYCNSMLKFSTYNVDPAVISSNRMVMFHGPPGSGKTSLCKALAQKLSIRLSNIFSKFRLMEINSHSLFSKYYSESGKLVMKLFELVRHMLLDEDTLIFLLIDEVESLVKSRAKCVSSSEPGDSLRVVNALLTQIDTVRRYPNILILTTSNMADHVDEAFMDRVDFMQYIDIPSTRVIYKILLSCIVELQQKKLICAGHLSKEPPGDCVTSEDSLSLKLLEVAEECFTVSGRSLRKLPIIAYSRLDSSTCAKSGKSVDLVTFLDSLKVAASKSKQKDAKRKFVSKCQQTEKERDMTIRKCSLAVFDGNNFVYSDSEACEILLDFFEPVLPDNQPNIIL